MALSKIELRDKAVAALVTSGACVAFVHDPAIHPFEIIATHLGASYRLRVYIWNITHGGRTRAAAEYRIQITGLASISLFPDGNTLILGYFEGNDTFGAWDATKHSGPVSASPSLQIREEHLHAAHLYGISVYEKSNEAVVAFAPEFFAEYVANMALLHGSTTAVDQVALNTIARADPALPVPEPPASSAERKRDLHTFARLHRVSNFRRRVLAAYNYTCAFCGIQMELVEAAHLLPVTYPGSTDATSNGVCLCSSHHRALDQGTVALGPEFTIVVSRRRLDDLRARNLHAGEMAFLRSLRTQALLPAEPGLRPTAHQIIAANTARNVKPDDVVPVSMFR